ncbi:MAG: STAS domain-containing protein [Acidimicrobiales bacterium]|jgi:anti-sigma B factor antagonist
MRSVSTDQPGAGQATVGIPHEGERVSVDHAFGISEHAEDGLLRVAVRGEVDVATAPTLREHLYDAVDRSSGVVVVDLSAVTFIDSTALGVLIGAQERSRDHGTQLRIILNEARIVKIFEITGLTELFSIFPTVAEAVAP